MKNFFKKWHGKGIEDAGTVTSKEFDSFSRSLKSVLKKEAEARGFELVSFSKGHYFVSGFLSDGNGFVYFSFDVPRGCYPLNLLSKDSCRGFLIRTAQHEKDYRGGMNNFSDFPSLMDNVERLLNRQRARARVVA